MWKWLEKLVATPKKSKAKIVEILRISSKPNNNNTTDELYEYLTGKTQKKASINERIHKSESESVDRGQIKSS
tara:strand:+ start:3034 stop:3252 length:219 start_codon:yes stop_codon:yes gene_type:complete